MGTHPIFESDFDCLTEMADLGFFGVGSDSSDSEEEVAPVFRTTDTRDRREKAEERVRFAATGGDFIGATEERIFQRQRPARRQLEQRLPAKNCTSSANTRPSGRVESVEE